MRLNTNLSLEMLRRCFEITSLRLIQRRYPSILSAYDDLIENNTRRIKILEEMAQMIYREWFVNFRFPGHQKVQDGRVRVGADPGRVGVSQLGQCRK